jgi:putative inorganic carbon (HCO3(-)) transporter
MSRERVACWLEKLSLWALAGLLVTLPLWRHRVLLHRAPEAVFFEFHDIILYTIDLLWWGAVGLWLLSRLLTPAPGKVSLGPWFLAAPLVGFLVLSTVGIPFAVDPLYAAYQTLRLLLLMALYLLLINAPLTPGAIAWPLATAMVLQAIVALPQFVQGSSIGLRRLGEITVNAAWSGASVVMVGEQRWLRAYGLTQHPNLLAGCLMAMLLVVGGYYLMQRGWKRLLLVAVLGLGLAALLLTFSRAAWLGVLLGSSAALFLLLWAWRRRQWSPNWAAIGLLVAVLSIVVMGFVGVNWRLLQPRLGLASQGTEIRSVESRAIQVPAAGALIQMRPVSGVGLGNYPTALYLLAREMVAAYPVYQPVYIVVLLVTAELGILGGMLWLSLVSLPWLNLWLRRLQVLITPWWAGLSGALVALTVVSFFDFYVWTSHQGRLVLWLVLGLWAREWQTAKREGPDSGGARIEGLAI